MKLCFAVFKRVIRVKVNLNKVLNSLNKLYYSLKKILFKVLKFLNKGINYWLHRPNVIQRL